MKTTSVFDRNNEAYCQGYRYIVNKGSTRSSKTYSQLQLLYLIARLSVKPRVISIVSESVPHLKKGCIRDFKEILENENNWQPRNWHASDYIYRVNNSIIEFFSADSIGKVHGPSRDILYLNECINIEYEIFRQLAIRTTETIFLDCNPSFEFWLDEKILSQPEALLIHSTYRDNDFLSQAQVREIESNKGDKDWWRVYGKGLTGNLKGTIVQNWKIVSEMPTDYKRRWIGLDFGFTNDSTAMVDVRLADGELWIDELIYERGMDNMMIAKHLASINIPRDTPIVADSAEPKSISEIRSQGWRVEPAQKGKDSINTGLSIFNRYAKNVTRNSLNVIQEYRKYKWQTDEFGEPMNVPVDRYNHAIDAQRYVCLNKLLERNNDFNYSIIKGKK